MYLMSQAHYATLVECLSSVPDPRHAQGRRYEWRYLVTVMSLALLAGQRSLRGMAQWAQERHSELVSVLQPRRRRVPSAMTLSRVLRGIDLMAWEEAISRYLQRLDQADGVSGSVALANGQRLLGQALDGKTVCGASRYGAVVHLVSLVRHESGTVLAQRAVTTKIGERTAAKSLLVGALMPNTLTTLDALHTHKRLAEQILAQGGHYLMVVKGNQPTLYREIAEAFQVLPPTTPWEAQFWQYACHATTEKAHGRIEHRRLESTPALNGYLNWPQVGQVLRRTCRVKSLSPTGRSTTTYQVHYGVTSLTPQQITLAYLEQLWRWHWTIENKDHYVRDVTWGEDASQVRTGAAPQALAALRNALLSLLRHEGWPSLPTAIRHFQAHLQLSLQLLGALSP
jgi:predicted transposase YbfD/YdcC